MREILFRNVKSLDFKRKDVSVTEKVYKSDSCATCCKHCRYIIKNLGKIKDVSNIDELFIKQMSLKKTPDREIYIKRRVSEKEGVRILNWIVKGNFYIVFKNVLLKIKYDYEYDIEVSFIPSQKNSHAK